MHQHGRTTVSRATSRHAPPTGFQPILIPQGCLVPPTPHAPRGNLNVSAPLLRPLVRT
jgi:hypothetical protein